MQGKKVSESEVVMVHLPMPDESNSAGTMHGGHLLKHIDNAAGLVACRHARSKVVTAALERMDFLTPIHFGEAIIIKGSINLAGRSSMEIGVRVEVEHIRSGQTRHAATCYVTYVAVDDEGRPQEVPPLIIESEDEIRRQAKALDRRARRRQS